MSGEEKQIIEKMKQVVIELHRSAGRLDNIIQSIENCYEEYPNDPEMVREFISMKYRARVKNKIDKGYNELDDTEEELWNELINH